MAQETPKKDVLVPLAHGSEEIEAVCVIDTLRRCGANVTVASVEKELTIVASRKLKIEADCLIDNCEKKQFDLIVLPGGMPGAERLRDNATLQKLLSDQAARKGLYAAICAAPAVALEPQGLLKGHTATAHPAHSAKLANQDEVAKRVVVSQNVVTSRGPGTALEFALTLAELLYGADQKDKLAKAMLVR